MDRDKRNRKLKNEHKRLIALLDKAKVPQQQRSLLQAVVDNMAWQRIKLDEAREEMEDASIVIPYDNGGGQTGIRENPIFKAYINLWRAYVLGLEKLTAYLPKEAIEEISADGLSILEQVKLMQKESKGERS